MPLLCAPPFDFLARLPLEAMLVLRPAASPDMKFRAAMLRAMALVPPLLTPMSILNFSVLIGAPTSASRLLTSFMPFSKRFISKPDSITSERVSTNSVMLISASSSSSGTIMSKTSTGSSPNCCKTAISLSPVLKTSSISLRVSIPFPSLSNDLNSLFNSFMSVRFFFDLLCFTHLFSVLQRCFHRAVHHYAGDDVHEYHANDHHQADKEPRETPILCDQRPIDQIHVVTCNELHQCQHCHRQRGKVVGHVVLKLRVSLRSSSQSMIGYDLHRNGAGHVQDECQQCKRADHSRDAIHHSFRQHGHRLEAYYHLEYPC
mmetsp:Transcript_14265/g.32412  ORF Transcript_14265/g.32412 Transcript_14265/m.32412 type:complete len:317 (-) Transcript_14265:694-1644(-)